MQFSILRFQFHTGSIKSARAPAIVSPIVTFQFHTGSIKSVSHAWSRPPQNSFNSILVRLKVQSKGYTILGTTQFQFHTGSIKS